MELIRHSFASKARPLVRDLKKFPERGTKNESKPINAIIAMVKIVGRVHHASRAGTLDWTYLVIIQTS